MKTHHYFLLTFTLIIVFSSTMYGQRNEWYNHSSYRNQGIEFVRNGEGFYALYNNEESGILPVFNYNTIYTTDTSGLNLIDVYDFVARHVNVHKYDEDSSIVVLCGLYYYHMDGPGAYVSRIGHSTLVNEEYIQNESAVYTDYFRNTSYAYRFERASENGSFFIREDSDGKVVNILEIPFHTGLKFIMSPDNAPQYFYHANNVYALIDYSSYKETLSFPGPINKVIEQPRKNRYILSTDSSLYILNPTLDTIVEQLVFGYEIVDFDADGEDLYVLLDKRDNKVIKVTLGATISRREINLMLADYPYRKIFYNGDIYLEGEYKGKSLVHRYRENKALTTNRRDLGIVSARITKERNERYIYTYFIEVTVVNNSSTEVHEFSYQTCSHHFNHSVKIAPGEQITIKDTIDFLDANLIRSSVTICGVDYRIDANSTNNTKSVDIRVGTEDLAPLSSSFYPNPAKGRLFFTHTPSIEEVIIMDMKGSTVLTTTKPVGHSMDISGLHPGTYWVETKEKQNRFVRKLVVLR